MEFKEAKIMNAVNSAIRGPLYVEANKMTAQGIEVLKLNTGNPATFGFMMPDSVKKALIENADKATAYCAPAGMPEARKAILDYHLGKGIRDISIDNIFIGNGVSEIAQMAVTVLVGEGDEVLVPSPGYSLWNNVIHLARAKAVQYLCDESQNWEPDVADIESKITPNTKVLLLINPNNPTGVVYSDDVLKKLGEIAKKHDLIIFSDEIYDRLLMDGVTHTSTAKLFPELPIITFNGLSKSHVVCGFRCGWMVLSGPEEFKTAIGESILKLCSMRLCGNALAQLSIPAALEDDKYTKDMLIPGGRLYEQREATCRALDEIPGITYVKNKGALYMFPKIDTEMYHITDDKEFAMNVLHETHLLFIPGSGFGWKTPDHFRLVMLPEPEQITEYLGRFRDYLATIR